MTIVTVNAKNIKYFKDHAQSKDTHQYQTTHYVDDTQPLTLTEGCIIGGCILLYLIFVVVFVKYFIEVKDNE